VFAKHGCFIYILFSPKINKFYIGCSADINDRLDRHNRATKGFTASGKPWQLVYSESYPSKHDALIREKQLKNWN